MPTPAAPQRAHLTANEAAAAKKAVREEMKALLKLKRKPFEDLLMDLYSRDQLMTLHRRSLGMKDAKDDWLVRKSKRWTKRKLAGEIYVSLHSCRLLLLQNGVYSIVFGVLAGMGVLGYGYHKKERQSPHNHSFTSGTVRQEDNEDSAAVAETQAIPAMPMSFARERRTREDSAAVAETQAIPAMPMSFARERRTRECYPFRKAAITTVCAMVAIFIAGLFSTTQYQTDYHYRFTKQLRTLRAKRPSALTRRLTRFVKKFTASK